MPIIVAKHAGFCMGVQQAVERTLKAADEAAQAGLACYTLGDLIHNPSVVSNLEKRGIQSVESPEDARDAMLILRSHGVTPQLEQVARENAAELVDCTCPFVRHLHQAVSDFSRDGAPVIMIGDVQHPEVVGTSGWCHGAVYVIAGEADIESLPEEANKALLVAQTTYPPQDFEQLSIKLMERFPGIAVKNTICNATAQRQKEAAQLAASVDCMIVVGGKNSANTRKLYQTCLQHCPDTYLVESAADLPPHIKIKPDQRIGVTAGASTPDWSLKEVIDCMNDMERKDQDLVPENDLVDDNHTAAIEAETSHNSPGYDAAEEKAPESEAGVKPEEDADKPSSDAADIASQYQAGVSPEVAEYIAPDVAARMTPENTASSASQPQEPEHQEPEDSQTEQKEAEHQESDQEAEAEPQEEPEQQEEEAPKAEPSFMDQVAASMTRIRSGQTLTGKVVQISDDEVCVNIGYKSDGLIKLADLVDENLELGDDIEVEIIKVNDGEGNVILSQRNIVNRKLWEEIKAKYEAGEFVDAVGKEAVKGGLLANIDGVRAFIPASHLSQRYVEKISQFVGQPMKLKIIEIDDSKKRVVASRKEVIAAENAAKKEELWSKLEEGTVVKGIVRRFATFGAFVDLGGIDGLIHITDLSWNRSAQPQDVLKTGEEIDVKILSLDQERERIQLGYKQLQPRPWDNVVEKYPVGTIMTRKVVRVRPFGAFVEMEPGVDGLVHISQVAMTRVNKVEDVVNPGQEVNVKILAVDPEAKRISLSIREAMEETIFEAPEAIPGEHDEFSFNEAAYSDSDENLPETDVAAAFKRAAEAVADRGEEVSEAVQEATQQPEEDAQDEPEAEQQPEEDAQVEPEAEQQPEEDAKVEPEAEQQPEEDAQVEPEGEQQPEEDSQVEPEAEQQPEEDAQVEPEGEQQPAEEDLKKQEAEQQTEPYAPAENAEGSEEIQEGEVEIAEAAPSPIEGDD